MFKSLGSRAALLTGTIAAVTVIISGLVAMPLIRDAAELQAQSTLARQADLVKDVATNPNDFDMNRGRMPNGSMDNDGDGDGMNSKPTGDTSGRALLGLVSYLQAQGIKALAIIPGTSDPVVLTKQQILDVANGNSISGRYCADDQCFLIEARPVGTGTGIVLVQPTDIARGLKKEAFTRIGIALVAGFSVAVAIGLLVSRKLTNPLKEAADAAHRLATGDRDVSLSESGPSEISEIAKALNVLAEELSYSEGRQREFLLSISHELRTPLTAIRGYAEAMHDGLVTGDEVTKVGSVVNAESIRLDRLVADLLDLARTGAVDFPLHLQEMDLRDVVNEASSVWSDRAAREEVQFVSTLSNGAVMVNSDPVRIRQIIDNLAENALRVTPSGQKIIFELTTDGKLQVRDSGPGLSPDDIKVAFQPGELYERYKGVRRVGTGFGLALVARLADRLGLIATAGKAPEGGASFTIDFAPVINT
ncbi:MAG: hypothetical protein RLZZ571_986 [Actinomycetota bacterium]|jgi:two-component system sensor histidine kinase BaeS